MITDRTYRIKDKVISVPYRTNKIILELLFLLLCCVTGVIAKKAINPVANMITDFLHIPGGISTAVSLMFLVIGTGLTNGRGKASMMGLIQGVSALMIGMVGSMGVLMPLAYLVPGVAIDLVMLIPLSGDFWKRIKAFLANISGSVAAALFADLAVFHLPVSVLSVYLLVAALSGAVCGYMAGVLIDRAEKYRAR